VVKAGLRGEKAKAIATANAGVLRFAQDDNEKQTTTTTSATAVSGVSASVEPMSKSPDMGHP